MSSEKNQGCELQRSCWERCQREDWEHETLPCWIGICPDQRWRGSHIQYTCDTNIDEFITLTSNDLCFLYTADLLPSPIAASRTNLKPKVVSWRTPSRIWTLLWGLASVSKRKRLDPLFHNCWGRKLYPIDLILTIECYLAASVRASCKSWAYILGNFWWLLNSWQWLLVFFFDYRITC